MSSTGGSQDGRDRGILSPSDRAFLQDEKELSEQGERDARYRIRNRIVDGLQDFLLLNNSLPDEDRSLVFEKFSDRSLIPAIAFLFEGLADVSKSLDEARETFEELLESAILGVYRRQDDEHIIDKVTVSIQVEKRRPDIDKLMEKYRNDEATLEELEFLQSSDEFEGDETLLSLRMMKHLHNSGGGLSEGIEEVILSETDHDDLDSYFESIDKLIAQEGSDAEDTT